MNIEKEREAFEAWYCENHTGLKQSDLAKFRTLSGYSFSDSLKIDVSWEAWQAAKAQAVHEGYVLMPIKPTETMVMAVVKEHEGDAFLPYSLYDAYVKQAMIEAQEPANESE